jgi:hypothetical protein
MIAVFFKCSWEIVLLQKENDQKLLENQNGLTLFELKLKSGEILKATKKNMGFVSRVNLVDS